MNYYYYYCKYVVMGKPGTPVGSYTPEPEKITINNIVFANDEAAALEVIRTKEPNLHCFLGVDKLWKGEIESYRAIYEANKLLGAASKVGFIE